MYMHSTDRSLWTFKYLQKAKKGTTHPPVQNNMYIDYLLLFGACYREQKTTSVRKRKNKNKNNLIDGNQEWKL